MEYHEIIGFVRRRYRPALLVFAIILIATTAFSFVVAPTFMSDCMLTIETGGQRQFLGEIPFLKELTTFSRTGTPLDTQIELVRITPRLRECIEHLDLRDKNGEVLEPKDLLEKIRIQPYENTDIIQIRAYDKDPEVARQIAQTLAENHLVAEKERDKEYAAAASRLMENEVESIKEDLDKVDFDLKQFIQRWGTINIEAEARAKVEILAELDREYYTLRAELAGVRNRRKLLEGQLNQQEPTIISSVTITQNPELVDLQRSLNGAGIRLAGLLTRYTEEHPEVISVREQITGYRERMSEVAARVVTSEIETLNPVHQQLMNNFAVAVASEEGLAGQLASVQSVREEKAQEALKDLGEKELEYISLQRRQKVLEQIFATMQARFVEVRIKEAASEATGRIVKDAEVPIRPIAPNRLVNIISGFVIGLVVAFLLAIGLEFTDKRLRGPEEIVKTFGLKQFGSLSRTPEENELKEVYGGIISALSMSGKGDRTVSFLCFGRPQVGLDALSFLSAYASTAGTLTLAVLDSEIAVGGEEPAGAGDLLAGLRDGAIKVKKHPAGFNLLATDTPYPIDLLLGDSYKRFLENLGKEGRAFIFAPVSSHPQAAPMACAPCNGTVLMVELRRTSISVLEGIIKETNAGGGKVIGFIVLTDGIT